MHRLVSWVQGFAESLGGPGLFIIAFLDSSFLSFPEVCDALVVLLTVRHSERMIFYALTTTLGSIGGCLALYSVGRKGGEAFLKKRFNERHIERAMNAFRRYGMLAIIVPSLLPPPMPFKMFVLLSGVARLPVSRFITAVAIGRGTRYFGEGLLALRYGDQTLAFLHAHSWTVALVLAIALAVGLAVYVLVSRANAAKGR